MIAAKNFRSAAQISADLGIVEGAAIGKVANGGFESAVKPEGAASFDWQISAGLEPQIVLTPGQKHGGNQSLALVFNSNTGSELRSISQVIAVEPGGTYEFEIYFKSDLRTRGTFKWEVADAGDGKLIASTGPIPANAEWTRIGVRFSVPASTDGIVVRLVRDPCGQVCPIAGNLWFDDAALVRIK